MRVGNTLDDYQSIVNVGWWNRQENQNSVDDDQEYPSNAYTIPLAGD